MNTFHKSVYLVLILLCSISKLSYAQVDLPEALEEGFIFCDFFTGANGASEVHLDDTGIIFNLKYLGEIKRIDSDLNVSTIIKTEIDYYGTGNFSNIVLSTGPAPAKIRHQRLGDDESIIIVTNAADTGIYGMTECYDSNFEVLEVSQDNLDFSTININSGGFDFLTIDIIFDQLETYYIVSNNLGYCTHAENGLLSYNKNTGELNYEIFESPLSFNPNETIFFKNQNHEIFFLDRSNTLYRLNPDLSYDVLFEELDVVMKHIFQYGEDQMLVVTSTGFDVYDNRFENLINSVEYSIEDKLFHVLEKNIYIYKDGKLVNLDENFEEIIILDSEEIPSDIQGIINNGEYSYLWGRVDETSLYIKAVNETTETFGCTVIDECDFVELDNFEHTAISCTTGFSAENANGFSYYYEFTLDGTISIHNNSIFPINGLSILAENSFYTEEFFVDLSGINIPPNSSQVVDAKIKFQTYSVGPGALPEDACTELARLDEPLSLILTEVNGVNCDRLVNSLDLDIVEELFCNCNSSNMSDPNFCINESDWGESCESGFIYWDIASCSCASDQVNLGCTDPLADNFDPSAECNDGSCIFPDNDMDGFPSNVDCNDNNSAIYPEAEDIPGNGIDEDCDGEDALVSGTEIKKSLELDNKRFYPNPTSQNLFFGKSNMSSSYQIISINGHVLKEGRLDKQGGMIEVSELQAGLYFIKYEGLVQKFIKN